MLRIHKRCYRKQRLPATGKALAALSNQSIRRAHMKIGAGQAYEDSFVLWLQAGDWYADVRVNLESQQIYSAFGGVVWWQAPKLYFQHLINISGELSTDDIGDIELTSFGCFERGIFASSEETIDFEEKWLFKQSQFTRVFTLMRQSELIGLEIQTEQYCILIRESHVKVFARPFGGKRGGPKASNARSWRTLFSTTPRENCWRPTGLKPKAAWRFREVAISA